VAVCLFRVGLGFAEGTFKVGIKICVCAVQSSFRVDAGCTWDWCVVGVGVI
jgi:hypothetical protein